MTNMLLYIAIQITLVLLAIVIEDCRHRKLGSVSDAKYDFFTHIRVA